MSVEVFIGPTLARKRAEEVLQAEYRPPVAQGDVYRAARRGARAIGIVDGYFEIIPAVWHKEILWAMSQGVHVFGSASMGALRAAELAVFGMRGVGEIFEAYARGALEDDDEVAVRHGAAESGYRALSEAMVNIRATLARAEGEAVISAGICRQLVGIAKQLSYYERSLPKMVEIAARQGVPSPGLERLRRWWPAGRVNQKRDDALAMLEAMREHLDGDPAPLRVNFELAQTRYWVRAMEAADGPTVRDNERIAASFDVRDALQRLLRR
jgi:hypothetical protein